jgi:ATP-binding cassette subfamily A (ABC1) protein 3
MKIMGLPGWLHWVGWFSRSFILLLLPIIFIVVMLKVNPGTLAVFSHSDFSVLFIFLLLFASSTITFTFLVSVFFSKGVL